MAKFVLYVSLGLAVAAVIYLQTPWGRRSARDLIQSQASRLLQGELRIGRVDGALFTGVELSDVVLTADGIQVVRIRNAHVRYSVLQILRGESIVIEELSLRDVVVDARRSSSGALNLSQLLKPRAPSSVGPGRSIDIRRLGIENGTITFPGPWGPTWLTLPQTITGLTTTLAMGVAGGDVTLPISSLELRGSSPALIVRRFAGTVAFTRTGWSVHDATLGTDRSDLRFGVNVDRRSGKVHYDVGVTRSSVHFPEFAKIAPGLRTIDVQAVLSLTMRGPEDDLDTRATLESAAGNLATQVKLNSTVPGWAGVGSADLADFDVSRWLPTEGVSRITGRADFDLLLGLGRHFPRGAFTFAGPYTAYAGYEASNVRAKGKLTQDRAELDAASAVTYGSPVRARGWIAIAAPYDFHLQGDIRDLDLRRLPASVPAPKVQTSLAFAYDTRGRFQEPYLTGEARFRPSTFLGAQIADGATGRLDTSKEVLLYSGAGRIADLRLATVGEAFQVETLRNPAYSGTLSGYFDLAGQGSTLEELDLRLGLQDATLSIFGGAMRRASFDGAVVRDGVSGKLSADLENINPSIPANDGRYEGALSGRVAVDLDLPGVLSSGLQLDTATIAGTLDLLNSRMGQVQLQTGVASGALSKGLINVDRASLSGTGVELEGSGTIPLSTGRAALKVKGRVEDLSTLSRWTPLPLTGSATVQGQVDGPLDQLAIRGSFTSNNLSSSGVSVLTLAGEFSGTVPERDIARATVTVKAAGTFLQSGRWSAPSVSTGFTYGAEQLTGDIQASMADGRNLKAAGSMQVHADHQEIHLATARVQLADQAWQVAPGVKEAVIRWDAKALHAERLSLVSLASPATITVSGSLGRNTPAGTIDLTFGEMPLQSLTAFVPGLAEYQGTVAGKVTLSGIVSAPDVQGNVTVTKGRFRNFPFERLAIAGRSQGLDLQGDVRLDEREGRWLTLRGTVPTNLFSGTGPSRPVDLVVRSSPIDLSVVEGFTTLVSAASGVLEVDVTVKGSSEDPHFDGFVQVAGAAFTVPATGASYTKGEMRLALAPDSIQVERFRLEDDKGDPLELTGSAATHQLRLGEFGIELSATRFEILQNELGDVDLNGVVTISGTPAAPVISGDLAIHRGNLAADRLLRYFDRPYATVAQGPANETDVAAAAVARWWDRASLRLRLLATNNLTFSGDDLRFGSGATAGLGNVNVTFGGDVTLRKRPGGQTGIVGVLTTERGSYAFQGRRFDIENGGTIRFTGDLQAPILSIAGQRTVASVQIRAALRGTTSAPELQLTSTPGLEQSDILSLLVFNVPANELATGQREALAIQAASLASGFVVSPAVSAVGRALGLDYLELERGADLTSPNLRLSAGREVRPGIFVTYGREFGAIQYNEVRVDYSLTTFLRLRGTVTDAPVGRTREGLFRRVERAGIDLMFFFSY